MRRMPMVCLLAGAAASGWAGTPGADRTPDQLLRAATIDLAASIKVGGYPRASLQVLERVGATVLPLFDVDRMTQQAMAQAWGLASSAQQRALVAEFGSLLARTYAATLAYRNDHAIEIKPLRMAPGEAFATIRSSLKQSGTEVSSVDYLMVKAATGWKVHDIRIAGVSMVASYRSAFAELVRARGVDGLLHGLSAANQQAESWDRSDESTARKALFSYSILTSVVRGSR
jgi:phospholipid transport system substrate-binding protein